MCRAAAVVFSAEGGAMRTGTVTYDRAREKLQVTDGAPRADVAADSDEALLARFGRSGERAALAALVERHRGAALRIAGAALGDPAAAEDAAQEAFVKLARAAGSVRLEGPFEGWFRVLVWNAARDAARLRGRRRAHERRAAEGRASLAAAPSSGALEVEEVTAHVERLPGDLQVPLVLHFYEGRTHEEVGRALGCPTGTASSRIRRGLERLRVSLGASGAACAGGVVTEGALGEALRAALEESAGRARSASAPSLEAIESAARAAGRRAFLAKAAGAVAAGLLAAAGVALVGGPSSGGPGPAAPRGALASAAAMAPRLAEAGPPATGAGTPAGAAGHASSEGAPGAAPAPLDRAAPSGATLAAASSPAAVTAAALAYAPPPYPYPDPRPTPLERAFDAAAIGPVGGRDPTILEALDQIRAQGVPIDPVREEEDSPDRSVSLGERPVRLRTGASLRQAIVLGYGFEIRFEGASVRLFASESPARREVLERRAALYALPDAADSPAAKLRSALARRSPMALACGETGATVAQLVELVRALAGIDNVSFEGGEEWRERIVPITIPEGLPLGEVLRRGVEAADPRLEVAAEKGLLKVRARADGVPPRLGRRRLTLALEGARVPDLVRALEARSIPVVVSPETWAREGAFDLRVDEGALDEALVVASEKTGLRCEVVSLDEPTPHEAALIRAAKEEAR